MIRRQDIRWSGGIAGRPLKIEFLVENRGTAPSEPKPVRIDVAPFGAFVPWRPLARLTLPGIPPGGRVIMTATAGDDELPPPTSARGSRSWMGLRALRSVARTMMDKLPPALRTILKASEGLEPTHFVGNLNVYVSECEPVERHRQEAIGLQAEMENWSMFCVGDGRDDRYTFRLEAERDWHVEITPGSWNTPMRGSDLLIAVRFVPPTHAKSGRVAIWVRRASTGQEVPVEFDLMADAPGPECYAR